MFGIPTCKEVFEKRHQSEELSTIGKLSRHFHMAICKNCRNFDKSMKLVEAKMKDSLRAKSMQDYSKEINEVKSHIKVEIKKQSTK